MIPAAKKLYVNSLLINSLNARTHMSVLTKRQKEREVSVLLFFIFYGQQFSCSRVSAIKYRWFAYSLYLIMNRDDDRSRTFIVTNFNDDNRLAIDISV